MLRSRIHISLVDILSIAFIFIPFFGMQSFFDTTVYMALGMLWIVFAYFENPHVFSKITLSKQNVILLLFSIFYLFTLLVSNGIVTSLAGFTSTLLKYYPLIIAMYYMYIGNNKRKNRMKVIVWAMIIGFMLSFVKYYYQNPLLARELASASTNLPYGVGGNTYGFCVAVCVFALTIIPGLLKNASFFTGAQKVVQIITIILCVIVCSLTDSATTFFLFIFSIIISIIDNKFFSLNANNIKIKKIFFYLLVFLGVFIGRQLISSLLIDIANSRIDFGRFITDRMAKVGYFLSGNGDLGVSFNERLRLIQNSFYTFLKYPLLGIDITGIHYSYNEIGQHCEFMDLLGRFGILGGGLIITYLLMGIKYVFCNKKESYLGCIIFLVFNAILNPLHYYQLFTMAFLISPLIICSNLSYDSERGEREI